MAKGKVNPMIGAAVGAGGGTVAAIAVRQFADPLKHPKLYAWSEAIGLGAAALSGAAMLLLGKKRWKQAGYTAMVAGLVNNGLRQAEMMLMKSGGVSGMGIVDIEPATALKGPVVDPTTVLQGHGQMGEGGDMPQLVGANFAQANQHVQLVGAPPLAEHAGAWGSTLFSR